MATGVGVLEGRCSKSEPEPSTQVVAPLDSLKAAVARLVDMESTDRQRWARVPPHLAWKHPGLPRKWTPVLERNEEAMNPELLPGYVWLGMPGMVLHAREPELEFADDPLA